MLLSLVACARLSGPEGWSGGVVAEDKLFIGTMEGSLVALELSSGKKLCEFQIREDPDRRNIRAIYGTPAIAEGTVFVGGYDGNLYSLPMDCQGNGQEKWEPDDIQPVGSGDHIVGAPVVVDGTVLIGSSDGSLYAFDFDFETREFSRRWTFATGNKVWGTPVVSDGVAYIGSLDHKMYAVDVAGGAAIWPEPFAAGGAITSAPVVANGKVYFGAFDSVFYAIDALSGEEVARFEGAGGWYWGGYATTGQTLYAPSLDGNLYAIDMAGLETAWPSPLRTDGALSGSPVIVGDRVAVASLDGKLRLVRLEDGSDIRLCDTDVKLRAPLMEHEGVIYFGATDHSIRALRVDSRGDPDEQWVHFTNEETPVDPNRDPDC